MSASRPTSMVISPPDKDGYRRFACEYRGDIQGIVDSYVTITHGQMPAGDVLIERLGVSVQTTETAYVGPAIGCVPFVSYGANKDFAAYPPVYLILSQPSYVDIFAGVYRDIYNWLNLDQYMPAGPSAANAMIIYFAPPTTMTVLEVYIHIFGLIVPSGREVS